MYLSRTLGAHVHLLLACVQKSAINVDFFSIIQTSYFWLDFDVLIIKLNLNTFFYTMLQGKSDATKDNYFFRRGIYVLHGMDQQGLHTHRFIVYEQTDGTMMEF